LFQLGVRGRSSDREVADPTGVGGLHQVVSEPKKKILSLFAEQQTKEEERKVGILHGNFTLLGGDAVKSCRQEGAEKTQRWKKK
jgi:hypothetical protein